jgi:hypothetical protein
VNKKAVDALFKVLDAYAVKIGIMGRKLRRWKRKWK